MPRSFGFEAEFMSEVPALIGELTERGLARQEGRLHGYHCDCDDCSDIWNVTFRAQRDSSCGGEIISGLFFDTPGGWERAIHAMEALQEAALDVDASTAMMCGMHVHLGWAPQVRGQNHLPPDDWTPSKTMTEAWLALEPILWEYIAGSVWAQRRGNNERVSALLMMMQHQDWEMWGDTLVCMEDMLGEKSKTFNLKWRRGFETKMEMMYWDRHADLARAGHGGFYEVRIFNASRAAWRTEMACRLSVALSKVEVAEQFAEIFREWAWVDDLHERARRLWLLAGGGYIPNPQRTEAHHRRHVLSPDWPLTLERTIEIFGSADERLGALLDKQATYQSVAGDQWSELRGLHVRNGITVPGHDKVLAALGG
ncbi:MAG TPA: hypothetical protein VNC22_23345 [Sporichthya sp.]|nr:hypothetical protein [Sporichthya sp.]